MLMPHESTVPHTDSHIGSFADLEETPCGLRRRSYASKLLLLSPKQVRLFHKKLNDL